MISPEEFRTAAKAESRRFLWSMLALAAALVLGMALVLALEGVSRKALPPDPV